MDWYASLKLKSDKSNSNYCVRERESERNTLVLTLLTFSIMMNILRTAGQSSGTICSDSLHVICQVKNSRMDFRGKYL